jgi:hypothetical protein
MNFIFRFQVGSNGACETKVHHTVNLEKMEYMRASPCVLAEALRIQRAPVVECLDLGLQCACFTSQRESPKISQMRLSL